VKNDIKVLASYNRGAELTHVIIKEWVASGETPRFAFPPREIALVADLRDIGKRLARNDSALRLVDQLIRVVVHITGSAPTAMMLRVVLEMLDQPIEWVAASELGLQVPRS
jgi:hypothetical protein